MIVELMARVRRRAHVEAFMSPPSPAFNAAYRAQVRQRGVGVIEWKWYAAGHRAILPPHQASAMSDM